LVGNEQIQIKEVTAKQKNNRYIERITAPDLGAVVFFCAFFQLTFDGMGKIFREISKNY